VYIPEQGGNQEHTQRIGKGVACQGEKGHTKRRDEGGLGYSGAHTENRQQGSQG